MKGKEKRRKGRGRRDLEETGPQDLRPLFSSLREGKRKGKKEKEYRVTKALDEKGRREKSGGKKGKMKTEKVVEKEGKYPQPRRERKGKGKKMRL